jgi:hypothetical protein
VDSAVSVAPAVLSCFQHGMMMDRVCRRGHNLRMEHRTAGYMLRMVLVFVSHIMELEVFILRLTVEYPDATTRNLCTDPHQQHTLASRHPQAQTYR